MGHPELIIEAVRGCGFDVVLGESGPVLRRVAKRGCVPADLMEMLKQNRGELVLYLTRQAEPDGEACSHCGNFVYPGNGVSYQDVYSCCLPPHRDGCPYRRTR